jgi:hypothetical protein
MNKKWISTSILSYLSIQSYRVVVQCLAHLNRRRGPSACLWVVGRTVVASHRQHLAAWCMASEPLRNGDTLTSEHVLGGRELRCVAVPLKMRGRATRRMDRRGGLCGWGGAVRQRMPPAERRRVLTRRSCDECWRRGAGESFLYSFLAAVVFLRSNALRTARCGRPWFCCTKLPISRFRAKNKGTSGSPQAP